MEVLHRGKPGLIDSIVSYKTSIVGNDLLHDNIISLLTFSCLARPQIQIFMSSKPRLFSGILAAAMSGFLSFTFLEPLFEPVGLELARVALYVLAINGSLVGLSLGVMLPTVFPGLCFGASAALFVGSFGVTSMPLYFPVVGGALALISATASIR